jgi:hypothetical protein
MPMKRVVLKRKEMVRTLPADWALTDSVMIGGC